MRRSVNAGFVHIIWLLLEKWGYDLTPISWDSYRWGQIILQEDCPSNSVGFGESLLQVTQQIRLIGTLEVSVLRAWTS